MYRPPPLNARIPIPTTVRWTVLLRARWQCEGKDCDERRVELHHVRYHCDDGGEIFGRETRNDLEVLCRDCHHSRHIAPDGLFWSDPEEMRKHWRTYADE